MSEAWATTFSIADVLMAAGAAGASVRIACYLTLVGVCWRWLEERSGVVASSLRQCAAPRDAAFAAATASVL